MKRLSKDDLWKGIIEELFKDFMIYFFPNHYHQIDFEKGFEFLDKELRGILPDSENKNRRVDKLVKVWLKDGREEWLLIHIEVQGYQDANFDYRVYHSYYRIRDKYNKRVGIFVIYTDKNKSYHPQSYEEECFGTKVQLTFPTYKVLDHPPQENTPNDNPFSVVMEAVWYEIQKFQLGQLTDEQYLEIGKKLVWKMARAGFDGDKISKVLQFIKHYVPFEKRQNFDKFGEEIDTFTNKSKDMGITELVRNYELEQAEEKGKGVGREQGLEQGLEQGEDIGIEKSLKIMDMLKSEIAVSVIAKELNVEIIIVEKIKEKMNL